MWGPARSVVSPHPASGGEAVAAMTMAAKVGSVVTGLAGLERSGGIDWRGQILTHLLNARMHPGARLSLLASGLSPSGSDHDIFFVVLPNKRQSPCIRSALPIDRSLLSG
jgi:hypothetical protein